MSNYSIHFSPTGGTKKVAGILTNALQGSWQEIDLCRDMEPKSLDGQDLCLIAVPSYGGRVPAIALKRLKNIRANGAKALLLCVYGNREWEDTLTELQDTLESCGFICAAAVAAVAEHSIFRQFAAGRPDQEDAAELEEFAARIREKLDAGVFGPLELAGSHGTYKEYNGVPFKPQANENCSGCGACAAYCPVGAIDPTESWKTDTEKCISCMRCVRVCRRHARDLDPALMAERGVQMEPKLGGRKQNYLFL